MTTVTGRLWLVFFASVLMAGCGQSDTSKRPPKLDGGARTDAAGSPMDPAIREIELHREALVFDALEAGPKDGALVFLLHGFPTTPFAFRPELTVLARAGYHAVAPLQRGYSSGARPSGDAEYAAVALADDVAGMADDLGAERFHLVGHDWGAGIAWVAAATHADRLLSLTIISTPHPEALRAAIADPAGDQSRMSAYTKLLRADDAVTRLLADDAALLQAVYGHPDRARELGTLDQSGISVDASGVEPLSQAHVDAYLDVLGDPAALNAALAYYRQNWGGLEDPAGNLSALTISVPTLFVWGGKDPYLGRQAAEATGAFVPNAPYRFVELPRAGHWIPELFADELTAEVLAHLGKN